MELTSWLQKQRIRIEDVRPIIKYTLDCGDAIIEKGSNRLQIMECIKDAYGKPYIPGSSLKGMFRTILLGADILTHPEKYEDTQRKLQQNLDMNTSRMNCLKKDIGAIENIAFRTLNRNETKPIDAVNDIFHILYMPLKIHILAQKVFFQIYSLLLIYPYLLSIPKISFYPD